MTPMLRRQFIKQAGVFKQSWDLIVLDAFNGDYIPEHLMTREFLDRFGLKDLTDLPKIEDMADALGFEPPAGLAQQATLSEQGGLAGDSLDEPATEEDRAVITGEGASDPLDERADPDE